MRFLSEDGKVFNTEKECYEYEKELQATEKEWKQMYDKVYKTYKDFYNVMNECKKKHLFKESVSYPEIGEFMNNLRKPINLII